MTPTLVASRTALPPEGALRLRPGEAGYAAPAWEYGDASPAPTLARSFFSMPLLRLARVVPLAARHE
jgi:hypothetical protein